MMRLGFKVHNYNKMIYSLQIVMNSAQVNRLFKNPKVHSPKQYMMTFLKPKNS